MRTLLLALLLAACSSKDPLTMTPEPMDGGSQDRIPLDSGESIDASDPVDASAMDANVDAGEEDAGSADAGDPPCDLGALGPADRDRVLIVGQPFSATAGQDGTEIRSLTLRANGELVDDGTRLEVGFRPARIEFTPDGSYALVLGEGGELASVRVTDAQTMALVDSVTLPSAGYGDLRVWEDGSTIFAVGSNVGATSGISTIHCGCDGDLSIRENEFFNVRLAASLAFLPDPTLAILLGGQAVFDPVDPDDVRLISYRAGTGWSLIDSFDIYADSVDALRIAVSPDGSTLLIPNGSPFSNDGNTVSVVQISGASLVESARLMNLDDAREALFSSDGSTALITLFSPGQIAVLADMGAGFVEVNRIGGIGLAENMASLSRGQLTDYFFITSVDASGEPNIATVRITGPGAASMTSMLNLGSGSEHIPVGIAVQP